MTNAATRRALCLNLILEFRSSILWELKDLVISIFISVRASDADLWDTFVMSEEEELWFSLFSLENLATKC